MYISTKDWKNYIQKLSALDEKAGELMQEWIRKNGFGDTKALIDYAFAVATKYGEGSASLAAAMYDAIAEVSGKFIEAAEVAATPAYGEVAKTVNGTLKSSQNPNTISNAISRLVKRTGADTMLKNAKRDKAQFAWVPNGDTCAFCIALASRGWQDMSSKALKDGHAEHIHANCDCTYAVRFDKKSGVVGYDPQKYEDMYYGAEGSNPQERINSLRRMRYAERKDVINAQKREAYAKQAAAVEAAQSAGDAKQPKELQGDFEDYMPLETSAEVRGALLELRDLAAQTNYEYGRSCSDGVWNEPHTDENHNIVKVIFDPQARHIELYHSHTDESPPSSVDLRAFLNEKVDRIGIASSNGDGWIIEIGGGIRPTKDEMDEAIDLCYKQAMEIIGSDPHYDGWSYEERSYMLVRERMRLIANYFEWDVYGGRL